MNSDEPGAALQSAINRKTLWFELIMVLTVFWVPLAISGIGAMLLKSIPTQSPSAEGYGIFSRLAIALLLIALVLRGGDSLKRLGFRPYRVKDSLVGLGLFVATLCLHSAYRPFIRDLSAYPYAVTHERLSHSFGFGLEAVFYLIAAFREELFYRAYLSIRLLDLGANRAVTILISALLFATTHLYQGWAYAPVHFLFGAMFSFAFLRYKSIWPLVVAHALSNSLMLSLAPTTLHR